MEGELAKCQPSENAGRDATDRLGAVGRGYIHFALSELGLFASGVGSMLTAGHDQTVFVSERDECGSVVTVELAQDVADVAFGSQWADDEFSCNFGVAESTGYEYEDGSFSVGELSETRR